MEEEGKWQRRAVKQAKVLRRQYSKEINKYLNNIVSVR
jgi:hypothetical protein